MQDFQEQIVEPYPLFTNEEYYEGINYPGPAEDNEHHIEEQRFSTGPVYDDYESDPWQSQGEGPEEPEEKQKGLFIPCLELVSEKPLLEVNQSTSASHPPVPTRDIQPCVSSCVAETNACYEFSGVFRSAYELVKEYMELYFLHVLEPPSFILTSTLGGKLKDVIVMLSRLHYQLSVPDRVEEVLARKLLEWLWWKFTFT
jgi:hypothetical protein